MNVIMFKAQGANLLMKADILPNQLDNLRRDINKAIAIKAKEAYMSYDEDGGITVTLIFDREEGKNN